MNLHLPARKYELALQIIGHLYFVVFGIMAIVFYQERIVSFDTAFYMLSMLKDDTLYTAHDRWLSYLPQILPYLVFKAGGSLKAIMIMYSLAFILVYYLLYNIAVYLFKNTGGGLLIALCLCLTMRYKWYIAVSETPLTLAFVAFWVSWHTKPFLLKKWQEISISGLILLFIFSGHPVMILPVFIFLGFYMIYANKWFDGFYWGLIAFTLVGYVIRYVIVFDDAYETERVGALSNAWEVLTNLNQYYVWEMVKVYFIKEYWLVSLVFVGLLGYWYQQKRFLLATYLWLVSMMLMAIILVTYSYIKAPVYNLLDGYLGMMGFVFALPILVILLQAKKPTYGHLVLVVLLFGISWYGILDKSTFYQQRLNRLSEMTKQHTNQTQTKVWFTISDFDWSNLWYHWSIPLETLLLSSLENREEARTVYILTYSDKQNKKTQKLLERDDVLLIFGKDFEPNELPPHLFGLKPSFYQEISLKH